MKQKLLKSLLAVALLFAGGNAWAGVTNLLDIDYSTVTTPAWTVVGGSGSIVDGAWKHTQDGGNGARSAYLDWGVNGSIDDNWSASFDVIISATSTWTNNSDFQIAVTKDGATYTNNAVIGNSAYILLGARVATSRSNMGTNLACTITLNGVDVAGTTTLSHDTKYTFNVSVDGTSLTASIMSGETEVYSGNATLDAFVKPRGIYSLLPRPYNSGWGFYANTFDNILVTKEVTAEEVSAPTISAAYAGANRTVTIISGVSSESNAVTTYYTTNGSDPTSASSVYSAPLNISENCTVKAISISSADVSSTVASLDVTVGKLTLNAPTFSKTAYSDGNYTVTMSSNQTGLVYVPASPVIKYSIDGGAEQTYSSAVEVPAGSTVTAHVEAENYTNSADAVLATGVMPLFAEVWSTDFTTLSEAEVEYTETTFGSTFYVLTNVNGNFGVAAVAGSNRFYIHNGGLYAFYGGARQFAINNLEDGDYIRITSSDATMEVSGVALQDGLSYGNVSIYKATADGIGIFSTPRYNVIYKVEVLKETTEVDLAILDCKQYETSAAFATAVAGESFANAAEVYAFHTAWQIAQADAASSNDITRVIRNAAVADGTDWNDARRNSGQQYTGAPDNTYFDAWDQYASNASQTIYGLPAGTYTLKVATRASETLTDINKYNVWVNGGTADARVLGHHEGSEGNFLGNGWNWTVITFTLDAAADVNIGFYSLPGKSSNLWAGCDDWHLYKGTLTHPVSISALGWATLYTPYALNFDGTGLTACTATVAGSTITLNPVTEVPANTGVVLNGDEGSYNIPVITSSTEEQGALTGNAAAATAYDAFDGYTLYALAQAEDYPTHQVQFRPVESGSIAAGKAFLKIANGSLVKAFDIDIAGADAIDDVRSKMEDGRSEIFNLAGQRMNRLQKGVNIVNGKKILVK